MRHSLLSSQKGMVHSPKATEELQAALHRLLHGQTGLLWTGVLWSGHVHGPGPTCQPARQHHNSGHAVVYRGEGSRKEQSTPSTPFSVNLHTKAVPSSSLLEQRLAACGVSV